MVSPGKHDVVLLDQTGWHLSGDITVPENISLLPLPQMPGAVRHEDVWQFMHDIWLSNRVSTITLITRGTPGPNSPPIPGIMSIERRD